MKDYKRLTDRVIAEMLRNTEGGSWDSDNIEAQCYNRLAELEDKIERGEFIPAAEYESARHHAEVVERALIIMAERVLEYAEKAKVTAMTSDGLFSCDKNAQLALLVNDALLKAEQKPAEEQR